MIFWGFLFTYSVKRRVTRYNSYFLFIYLTVCSSSHGISDSILSLGGFLFTLFLSWLWLCREFEKIVKALIFFLDNCCVKKLITSSFFEIFFSDWEILFLNRSNAKQSPLLPTRIKLHCCRWGEVATRLLTSSIPSSCREVTSTSSKLFKDWTGVVFLTLALWICFLLWPGILLYSVFKRKSSQLSNPLQHELGHS